jgi:hypothetical protein
LEAGLVALSHAERQRRYRERKRAELGKQVAPETGGVTSAVTRDDVTPSDPRQPRYLRARGRRLWAELTADNPGPADVVLIEEACRLADRLDKLDAILGGRDKAWITLEIPEGGVTAEVIVDKVLSEARQQQIALKQLLGELRQSRASTPAKPLRPPQAATSGGTGAHSGVADLTTRIAERRAQAKG